MKKLNRNGVLTVVSFWAFVGLLIANPPVAIGMLLVVCAIGLSICLYLMGSDGLL